MTRQFLALMSKQHCDRISVPSENSTATRRTEVSLRLCYEPSLLKESADSFPTISNPIISRRTKGGQIEPFATVYQLHIPMLRHISPRYFANWLELSLSDRLCHSSNRSSTPFDSPLNLSNTTAPFVTVYQRHVPTLRCSDTTPASRYFANWLELSD